MNHYNINYKGKEIIAKEGSNLRKVLIKHNLSPYNGAAKHLNCRGLGSCGTCAVKIQGEAGPKTFMERWRLRFPPHKSHSGLRLACQVRVRDDLFIQKGKGFWGEIDS